MQQILTLSTLTNREREVIEELCKGLGYKEIACRMFVSRETVKQHLKNIYRKMGVNNRMQASMQYMSEIKQTA